MEDSGEPSKKFEKCNNGCFDFNMTSDDLSKFIAAKIHVYPTKDLEDSDAEVLENDEQEREVADEFTNKRTKYDSLAEFKNAATDSEPRKKSSTLIAKVNEELRRYSSIHKWCKFKAGPCYSEHI